MSESPKKESDKSYTIVILTAVFALIGSIITGYFGYKANYDASMIPIIATQTAEARLLTQAAESRLETQTAELFIPTSTISLPTETLTEAPPTGVVNTDTPPPPTQSLPVWDVFSTDGVAFPSSTQSDCPNIEVDELGIISSKCELIFTKGNIDQRGIHGLSIPIKRNDTIQMTVTVTNLVEGEFWVGFSNGIDPQSDSLIYAMTPNPGGISVYLNDISSALARYAWADMGRGIGWARGQPWQYNFTIKLTGNKVSVDVNGVSFASVIAPSTGKLFIGYHSKPEKIGMSVDATISNLIITENP